MKNMKHWTVIGAMTAVALLTGTQTAGAAEHKGPSVCFASDLIGKKVLSTKGEDIGKIEDVVVHPGGDVAYAVLSFGGVMGVGDKLFAIPWGVLESKNPEVADKDSDRKIILPIDKERLKNAPGFDKGQWPAMAGPDWAKDVDSYYKSDNKRARAVEASAARAGAPVWKASDLKGFNVETPSGEKLGDIKEVAIDMDGRISYLVLSVGGFLGMGDKLIAVPWEAVQATREGDKGDKKKITLATTKERLKEAPSFKSEKEARAEMCDPAFMTTVYRYYSIPPYWTQGKGDEKWEEKPSKTPPPPKN